MVRQGLDVVLQRACSILAARVVAVILVVIVVFCVRRTCDTDHVDRAKAD